MHFKSKNIHVLARAVKSGEKLPLPHPPPLRLATALLVGGYAEMFHKNLKMNFMHLTFLIIIFKSKNVHLLDGGYTDIFHKIIEKLTCI